MRGPHVTLAVAALGFALVILTDLRLRPSSRITGETRGNSIRDQFVVGPVVTYNRAQNLIERADAAADPNDRDKLLLEAHELLNPDADRKQRADLLRRVARGDGGAMQRAEAYKRMILLALATPGNPPPDEQIDKLIALLKTPQPTAPHRQTIHHIIKDLRAADPDAADRVEQALGN